jgi:DNA-binding CsgD family transcriptional regulator
MKSGRQGVRLVGRSRECQALDDLVARVRTGCGGVVVVHGPPGIGKSALLDYVAASTGDLGVLRGIGVPAEVDLGFAALRRLCTPILDRIDALPAPQRDALSAAFGLVAGPGPDRFLVGLATHGLLTTGHSAPMVCLVDDVQWLDNASAQTLAFVARRLESEPALLILAVREPGGEFQGLPELCVPGLADNEADQLLASARPGLLDQRVRDQILAEARGNPAALLNRPPADLEEIFRTQMAALPEQTRRLLVLAAAEPVGDPAVVLTAAQALGLPAGVITMATDAGLLDLDTRIRFPHPLARSAAYQQATLHERQTVHQALAGAVDPGVDPGRRVWHLAQAAPGPDDEVADELIRLANHAPDQGGLPATAAFLDRAAALTTDIGRRAERALAAADALISAGAFGSATELLALVPADSPDRERYDFLQARLAYAMRPHEAEAYLEVLGATRTESPSEAARWLVAGLTALNGAGYAHGVPLLRRALDSGPSDGLSDDEVLRFGAAAVTAALHAWDDAAWDRLTRRRVELARRVGALGVLLPALTERVYVALLTGRPGEMASLTDEIAAVSRATGAETVVNTGSEDDWTRAVRFNGRSHYEEARQAALSAADANRPGPPSWALAELVEAATRTGAADDLAAALERLSEVAQVTGTNWALGIEARSRAVSLLDGRPEHLYKEAIERLAHTRLRTELARSHLVYGEWLRREGRRVDAREHLHAAVDLFTAAGLDGFTDRARRELAATGETARKRGPETGGELTAQELQIARLARDGLSNPEISVELFISARTVEWHLRKVFTKLGVSSRRQLRHVLTEGHRDGGPMA